MPTAILIAAEVRDLRGKVLDPGFGEDKTFVVVTSVAFVTASTSAAPRLVLISVVVGLGSVVVCAFVSGINMALRVALVICVVTA